MSSDTDRMVKLCSQDDVEFLVSYKAAIHSNTLRDLLEATADCPSDEPIPIPTVDGDILKLVIEWCEHYKDKAPEEFVEEEKANIDAKCDIPEWDMQFLKPLVIDTMMKLLCASNYLDVVGLMNTACKKVGGEIKGQTPEFLRDYFNIVNDYTPEEEEALRIENAWAEEPLTKAIEPPKKEEEGVAKAEDGTASAAADAPSTSTVASAAAADSATAPDGAPSTAESNGAGAQGDAPSSSAGGDAASAPEDAPSMSES